MAGGCTDDTLSRLPTGADDAGRPAIPPRPTTDAGVPVDAGHHPPVYTDAAVLDAAPRPFDAGSPVDVGFDIDSGTPPNASCYTEPFDPTVDLSDLQSNWRSDALGAIMEALRRRWPAGHDLLYEERNDPYTGTFIDRSSFGSAMESSMTETHEATHGWDYGHSLFRQHFDYYLRGDLTHSLSFAVDGFPRSRIHGDVEDNSTSLYRNLYLSGDQGTRGLLELLDEMNCYINGLGAIAAIGDQVPYGISGRDGAVAFLYYLQLYLRRARTTEPTLYATMQGDAALVAHVTTQWLRAHFFLMFADAEPHIGIRDDEIRANLYATHNIAEISMLIGRCVDQTNCLCD